MGNRNVKCNQYALLSLEEMQYDFKFLQGSVPHSNLMTNTKYYISNTRVCVCVYILIYWQISAIEAINNNWKWNVIQMDGWLAGRLAGWLTERNEWNGWCNRYHFEIKIRCMHGSGEIQSNRINCTKQRYRHAHGIRALTQSMQCIIWIATVVELDQILDIWANPRDSQLDIDRPQINDHKNQHRRHQCSASSFTHSKGSIRTFNEICAREAPLLWHNRLDDDVGWVTCTSIYLCIFSEFCLRLNKKKYSGLSNSVCCRLNYSKHLWCNAHNHRCVSLQLASNNVCDIRIQVQRPGRHQAN